MSSCTQIVIINGDSSDISIGLFIYLRIECTRSLQCAEPRLVAETVLKSEIVVKREVAAREKYVLTINKLVGHHINSGNRKGDGHALANVACKKSKKKKDREGCKRKRNSQ